MFSLLFASLGGSFVFLEVGSSILFLNFPPFLGALVYFLSARFHHHFMCQINGNQYFIDGPHKSSPLEVDIANLVIIIILSLLKIGAHYLIFPLPESGLRYAFSVPKEWLSIFRRRAP